MQSKRFYTFICAAVTAAAALSACTQDGGMSVSSTESSSIESSVVESSIATNPPERHMEEYVETVKEYENPVTGTFLLTGEESGTSHARMPQLKLNSADAQAVNSKIHESLDRRFDGYANGENIFVRTDYVCALNDSTLSLAIESRTTESPNSGFSVYNFNVDTGNLLSNEEVVSLAGVTMEEAHAALSADINAICDEGLSRMTDESLKPKIEEVRKRSLEEENLNKAAYFFDNEGRLNAAYRYYWVAGQGDNGALLVTSYSFIG